MTKMDDLIKTFGKTYKDDTIVTVGVKSEDPSRLPTDWFSIDLAIGGGVPEGRATIIYGLEDSMKTSVCLKLVASAQRKYPNKKAVFVDIEGVFSKTWATALGVDIDSLVYIQPDDAEQTVDIVEGILYTDDVSVIVVDSLASLLTQHELGKSAEDAIVGRTGLAINKFYRKASRALGQARRSGRKPTLVCINQIRYKIGVTHGNPEVMPGGPAFKFFSSLSMRFYGKDIMDNKISKTLPSYKELRMTVKKYKVPLLSKSAIINVALLPIEELGLGVGETKDWNTLLSYLKSMQFFVKAENKKDGWMLIHPDTGEASLYKKQDDLKAKVYGDRVFGQELKSALISAMMQSNEVID